MIIAIDIILKPEKRVSEISVELNNKYSNSSYPRQNLNTYIPHISIWMGYVDSQDIDDIKKNIDLSKKYTLMTKDVSTVDNIAFINVLKSRELIDLQQYFFKMLDPFEKKEKGEILDCKDELATRKWIDSFYLKRENPDLFNPHITLGFFEYFQQLRLDFEAKLDLYQLGNHCTCAKKL